MQASGVCQKNSFVFSCLEASSFLDSHLLAVHLKNCHVLHDFDRLPNSISLARGWRRLFEY